ncbi:MAG: alpha/beta fold hydrolase [Betaproteobacteria bacterium]|nr:alpha/beta fold hydrolase [Betaproteobacteria bacterium]
MIRPVFRYRFVFVLFVALVAAPAPRAVAAPDPPDRAGIAIEQGELASISGCRNSYTLFRPARPTTGLTALIVPGFMRDRDRMRGWADEIAGRGMAAVTMDFCQPTAFDGRHAENARDMIAVRAALGIDRIVYVGHSAGGLASLLAAADDAAARGMVLLDPVDFGDLAEDAAVRATVPALVLLAKPGVCNLRRNIRHALPRLAQATTVSIDAATHCDFEWPSDRLCRAACDFGGPAREQRIESEQRIRALVLDFLDTLRAVADDERPPVAVGRRVSSPAP